ncbi:curved DNA-binding protein [Strigomonas culicis]|uniref:Curved DNA-binding protein n=1 Tax=Strigomonas culicis TaxID=28005 RepID=S9U463_9TRYP|nr:curved DNA-binding protein [Strigomonas culicis]EPY23746.1 heat shock protein DNAJ [Strigomonas culicis]EPY35272.1 curved DNA-binding protein [Strigomonas culicis]|eukprot:EPY23564.1 curved DNA-binding protein [Strigomonas culicis]
MRLGVFPRRAAFSFLTRPYSSRTYAAFGPSGASSVRRPMLPGSFSAPRAAAGAPFTFSARNFSSTSEDYYATLGVSANATQDEIKAAYKKLALQFHPDRNHEAGAEEKFKTISAAYNVVGNKEKRREYDAQRSMFNASAGRPTGGGAQTHQGFPGYGGHNAYQYREMSKEEADRLFREIFGGMRVEQIFRNFEEELRKGNMRSNRGGVNVGHSFNSSDQTFRPFFTTHSSTSQFVDAYGNRMEETVYQDGSGHRYTVRRSSSSDPNASVNQTADDYFKNHKKSSDGRVHFGRSSVKYNAPNTDFTQQLMGVRSHGRSPLVGILLLFAWFIVITTLLYCFIYFMARHPIFTTALFFILLAGRIRRF